MGNIGYIVFIAVALVAVVAVFLVFAGKKKSKENKAPAQEAKVEPVFKKEGEKAEPVSEASGEKTLEKEPPKDRGFKIVRKKSEVKINRKALKADSRNPSITRVFVNGKRVDEQPEPEELQPEGNPENTNVMPDITSGDVGRFGAREPVFGNTTKVEIRMPNRAPIIGDRTNFGSHLVVRDDNNLSGVSGTGIAKALADSEARGKDIDSKTSSMVENVKRNMLGQTDDPLKFLMEQPTPQPQSQSKAKSLSDIDARSLVMAEVVLKRKGGVDSK